MNIYVIYKHPSDYSKHYVVREMFITKDGTQHGLPNLYTTLQSARNSIPAQYTRVKRHDSDDKVIVETWI